MNDRLRRKPRRRNRFGRRRAAGAGLALLLSLSGCGREFYRNWADQDVSEAVFEKSRDPRWRLDLFSIEPPAMSRFADPYDPDRPPAPPDDYASQALSPVPQAPHHRLLTPAEGTGYIDMLEQWQRDRPASSEEPAPAAGSRPAAPTPPPPPGPSEPAPFQPPRPGGDLTPPPDPVPIAPPADALPPATAPPVATPAPAGPAAAAHPAGIPGSPRTALTPIPSGRAPAPRPAPPAPAIATVNLSGSRPPQARTAPKDTGVLQTALQAPEPAQPASPGGTPPPADRFGQGLPLDPNPNTAIGRDAMLPVQPNAGFTPEGFREAGQASAGLAALLSPTREPISDIEVAALPEGQTVYKINPQQALTLALANSRSYQLQLEQIYLRALDVTLARFNFTPQFYAGLSPSTGRIGTNFANSFLYRTAEAPGGQQSLLNLGTAAGVSKTLSFGGSILAGFANQTIFNLVGSNPVQPTVQSVIPITIVQPFLRGGGRAVTLEPLTLAERNLLYQIRVFARFRQEFVLNILTQNQAVTGGSGDPSIGYLNVLSQLQQLENTRTILAAYEAIFTAYQEMASGAGAGVSQLNVDQIDQNIVNTRNQLIQQTIQFQTLLDQYKVQLGLPPDLPLVVDRGLTQPFRDVFSQVDRWFGDENRDPAELPRFVERLPRFEDVVLDGRPVVAQGRVPQTREDVLLAAERIALENRYELMNARAQLYDAWRQLAVRHNALKGIFNVSVTNQIFTPTNTTNPFAFVDQAKQFALTFNTELPLVRVSERNAYRQGLILYRQQQRALMQLEDQTKLTVRQDVRALIQNAELYENQKRLLVISLRQRDNSARTIFAPPGAGGVDTGQQITANTTALIGGIQGSLNALNGLINQWVSYQTARLSLYRDLGILPYDEWEVFYALFPDTSAGPPDGNTTPDRAGTDAPRAAEAPPAGRP
jgi:hypothetical protein